MTSKEERIKVDENIKKYLGFPQNALSKKADLALHTISKIESGSTPDPQIDAVKKITDAFDVPLYDLIR